MAVNVHPGEEEFKFNKYVLSIHRSICEPRNESVTGSNESLGYRSCWIQQVMTPTMVTRQLNSVNSDALYPLFLPGAEVLLYFVWLDCKMYPSCWIQQAMTIFGVVPCWIQQLLQPKWLVRFKNTYREIQEPIFISKLIVRSDLPRRCHIEVWFYPAHRSRRCRNEHNRLGLNSWVFMMTLTWVQLLLHQLLLLFLLSLSRW